MKHALLILTLISLSACQSTYYKAWEFLGKEKRDLLTSKIEDTKDSQKDSQKEVKDILEQVRNKYGLEAKEIESFYDNLKSDYESFKAQANELKGNAKDVRTIAKDLFQEWEQEAYTFKNSSYKRSSLKKLQETKREFNSLSRQMAQSEAQLDQVLNVLRDQVLFLKHNLNAKTLASFEGEFDRIEKEIETLIRRIDQSLSATENFQLSLD